MAPEEQKQEEVIHSGENDVPSQNVEENACIISQEHLFPLVEAYNRQQLYIFFIYFIYSLLVFLLCSVSQTTIFDYTKPETFSGIWFLVFFLCPLMLGLLIFELTAPTLPENQKLIKLYFGLTRFSLTGGVWAIICCQMMRLNMVTYPLLLVILTLFVLFQTPILLHSRLRAEKYNLPESIRDFSALFYLVNGSVLFFCAAGLYTKLF